MMPFWRGHQEERLGTIVTVLQDRSGERLDLWKQPGSWTSKDEEILGLLERHLDQMSQRFDWDPRAFTYHIADAGERFYVVGLGAGLRVGAVAVDARTAQRLEKGMRTGLMAVGAADFATEHAGARAIGPVSRESFLAWLLAEVSGVSSGLPTSHR